MRGSKRKRKEKKRKSAKRSADYTRRSADYTREYGGSDDDLEVNQEFKDLMMEASKSFVQLGSDLKDFHTQWVALSAGLASDEIGCRYRVPF
jgi:hypothetical protein